MAQELGYTVKDLLGSVDSFEITEWIAFFQLQNETLEKRRDPKKALDAKTKVRNIMSQLKSAKTKRNKPNG